MITISACLIVKNEEHVLRRCLDSLKELVEEIIIVDTGSSDHTISIAKEYTDKVYEFEWVDDFSAARNYSFAQATMDYIYTADADEVIDEENQNQFLLLKKALLPEVEIVQMLYSNQLTYNTVYNYDCELRPKLYKRLRTFLWVDPIHETVALSPVIFDSDVTICHLPTSSHVERDLAMFLNTIKRHGTLSPKLRSMYARELFIAGKSENFIEAKEVFLSFMEEAVEIEEIKYCQCVLAKASLLSNEIEFFFQICLKNIALEESSSEICCLLGDYYFDKNDYKEASIWFYNAAYEAEAELNLHYQGDYPLLNLAECYERLGDNQMAKEYRALAEEWAKRGDAKS